MTYTVTVPLHGDGVLFGGPHRALGPRDGRAALQFDHAGMLWLVSIEIGERAAGENQASRLDRVLVGHDDERTVGDREVASHRAFHPLRDIGQGLRCERKVVRVLQVRSEFARERFVKGVPPVPGPSRAELPLGQRVIDEDSPAPALGDDRRRLHGSIEGGGDDGRVIG